MDRTETVINIDLRTNPMRKSLLATFAALAVLVSAAPATLAFAAPVGSGTYQACEDHDYTPHGIWDCR